MKAYLYHAYAEKTLSLQNPQILDFLTTLHTRTICDKLL